jgi:hypothetical protein
MTAEYDAFLAAKMAAAPPVGFEPHRGRYPDATKAFQADVVSWACRRGKAALFEGTGLGKTLQELTWAQEVVHETGKPVLNLTGLAIAEQTVSEAEKFGIDGVAYAEDQGAAKTPIPVTNYDRLHLFDPSRFGGAVLDESSILKSSDGATRAALMEFCRDIPYVLPATATPAPNDWTELGQHAELLGVMTAKEMLATYFVHDGSNRVDGGDGWRLKRHAEADFWAWLASWAVMIRHPRDLGYDEPGYDLPPLHKHQVTVPDLTLPSQGFFHTDAGSLQERLAAKRDSIPQRVGAAAEIALSQRGQPWVHWCHLNAEAEAMAKAIPGAVNLTGSDDRETKKAKLRAFARGEIEDLVSKPSLTAFGLNWQHCRRFNCVGLNDSFEQLYQLIRRFWRFGQTESVHGYFIASEREGAVVKNLDRKERDFERALDAMASHMRDLNRAAIRGGRVANTDYTPTQPMELPRWLTAA